MTNVRILYVNRMNHANLARLYAIFPRLKTLHVGDQYRDVVTRVLFPYDVGNGLELTDCYTKQEIVKIAKKSFESSVIRTQGRGPAIYAADRKYAVHFKACLETNWFLVQGDRRIADRYHRLVGSTPLKLYAGNLLIPADRYCGLGYR